MKKICVIGSLNVDLSIRIPRFHMPGETITGSTFETFTGGKGGNQAVAAARLGFETLMVGKLGEDGNGKFYLNALLQNGVDTKFVAFVPGVASGVALIEVDDQGENRIAIVPGTNALVDIAMIDELLPQLLLCDIFLMQLEIPIETVCYAAKVLHEHGKTVILDPAPAIPLPESLFQAVDYLTPNQAELLLLTGMPVTSLEEAEAAAKTLLDKGTKAVIAKLGEAGSLYVSANEVVYVQGFSVNVVDTTAAGDSFNAGLAVGLAQQNLPRELLSFSNAVGALSTTASGAQQAMPTMEKVLHLLAEHR